MNMVDKMYYKLVSRANLAYVFMAAIIGTLIAQTTNLSVLGMMISGFVFAVMTIIATVIHEKCSTIKDKVWYADMFMLFSGITTCAAVMLLTTTWQNYSGQNYASWFVVVLMFVAFASVAYSIYCTLKFYKGVNALIIEEGYSPPELVG